MALTVRYIFKVGDDLRMGHIQEVQGTDNIRNIQKTRVHDNVGLGITPNKKIYRVLKVEGQTSGDDLHMDITVIDISQLPSD